jgi:hypothetical protein
VKLDRLYEAVDKALRELSEGVGIVAYSGVLRDCPHNGG